MGMKQNVPTAVAVIVIVLAIAIAAFVIWRKAGEKPIVGFPEKPVGVGVHPGMQQKMKPVTPEQTQPSEPKAPTGE